MLYEEFLETVRVLLQAELGPQHRLERTLVTKNNGVHLNGISDYTADNPMAPTIYLDSYYDCFQKGTMTLAQICQDIRRILTEHSYVGRYCPEDFGDVEKMKPLIMMRMIHAPSNRELLEEIPYVAYLDLAIVFYLSLDQNEDGQMTVLIRQEHRQRWGLSDTDLLKLAMENTPAAYPAEIHSMSQVLKTLAGAEKEGCLSPSGLTDDPREDESENIPLFVLTNSSGVYGASCMLYRDVLKNFAKLLASDLIIIPSSIHEVLLTPYSKNLDFGTLNTMVTEINQSEVTPEDRLCDHIYLYSRAADEISIPVSQNPVTSL